MRTPGYKTSEFWFTLVSFIVSGLFLFGVITEPDTKDQLIDVFTHATESILLLGGQGFLLYKYLGKRRQEKIEYEKTKQKEADNNRKELEDYVGIDKTYKEININTAKLAELIQLPHIGPILAQNIIDYRNSAGKFRDKVEMIAVKDITYSMYEDIKPYIIL